MGIGDPMSARNSIHRRPGPIRLCHVTTSDLSLARLYTGQHRYFIERGYEVWGIAAPDCGLAAEAIAEGLQYYPVRMGRRYGILTNLLALFRCFRFFRRMRFDVVEGGTSPAGLVAMLCGWLARVPVRVYTLHGMAYELSTGLRRWAVRGMDRWACRLSTRVLAVCHELRERCPQDGLCKLQKVTVVGAGSCNGLDVRRFCKTERLVQEGRNVRRELSIPDGAFVLATIARLKVEKGVCELLESFQRLDDESASKSGAADDGGRPFYMLLVGDFVEGPDAVPVNIRKAIGTHPRVRHVSFQNDTERYYAATDLFVLPSYREGFGISIIEASAMELPVITSDCVGCREAALDGETGILVPVKNVEQLTAAINKLVADPELCARLGQRGRQRVEEVFDQRKFWPALEAIYRGLLRARGLPVQTADDRNESTTSRGVAAAS